MPDCGIVLQRIYADPTAALGGIIGLTGKQEYPIQGTGFWVFGLLSVVLAVLKRTVAGYWSWWRVMLPFLAFLGHNAVYVLAGFLCFCWLKYEEDEEDAYDA